MNGDANVPTLWQQAARRVGQILSRGLAVLGPLLQRVPRSRLVLWGACALLLAAWWYAHQARLRQSIELALLQKQTATALSTLEAGAAAAIRQANERNAHAIHELEAQRRKLERDANGLAARLQALQQNERAQAAQTAILPPAELARRVAAELGNRESGSGSRGSSDVKPPASSVGSSLPTPDSPLPTPALVLSEPQLRNLAAALVERDACREQQQVVEAQFTNCRGQVDTNATILQHQADSLAQLNTALSAKDEILKRRETQHQAELKAARGSRLARLARVVEYVAIGVAIGAVLR